MNEKSFVWLHRNFTSNSRITCWYWIFQFALFPNKLFRDSQTFSCQIFSLFSPENSRVLLHRTWTWKMLKKNIVSGKPDSLSKAFEYITLSRRESGGRWQIRKVHHTAVWINFENLSDYFEKLVRRCQRKLKQMKIF